MVPCLNALNIEVACYGNHDFGQFAPHSRLPLPPPAPASTPPPFLAPCFHFNRPCHVPGLVASEQSSSAADLRVQTATALLTDFGEDELLKLSQECTFPWVLTSVLRVRVRAPLSVCAPACLSVCLVSVYCVMPSCCCGHRGWAGLSLLLMRSAQAACCCPCR